MSHEKSVQSFSSLTLTKCRYGSFRTLKESEIGGDAGDDARCKRWVWSCCPRRAFDFSRGFGNLARSLLESVSPDLVWGLNGDSVSMSQVFHFWTTSA